MDTEKTSTETGLVPFGSFKINPFPKENGTSTFKLIFSEGSVVDFHHQKNPTKAAIVNAANEECLGGGGVDGAISDAGGPNLLRDRLALPAVLGEDDCSDYGDQIEVRCPIGDAKLTGPGDYGSLNVSYVIHAVGPNYLCYESCLERADGLLRSAYTQSLERAKEVGLESVAFCLLSAGIFRGRRSLDEVLRIGVESICDFDGYGGLKEVHLCAFSVDEVNALTQIAENIGLEKDQSTSRSCATS